MRENKYSVAMLRAKHCRKTQFLAFLERGACVIAVSFLRLANSGKTTLKMNKVLKRGKALMVMGVEKSAPKLCKVHRGSVESACNFKARGKKVFFKDEVNKIYFLFCQEKLLAKCNENSQCERQVTSF